MGDDVSSMGNAVAALFQQPWGRPKVVPATTLFEALAHRM
jgi:hypothetical protein